MNLIYRMSSAKSRPAAANPRPPDFPYPEGATTMSTATALAALRAGQKVLDVAAGNGNVTLAAARRWCEVTSTDYVPALLDRGRARAEADGFDVVFKEADAE